MHDAADEPSDFARARALFTALRGADERRQDDVLMPLERREPQVAHAVRLMLAADRDESVSPFATPLFDVAASVDRLLEPRAGADEAARRDAGIDFGPKYILLAYIGRGSAGEVHLAEQLHPVRRQVALKLFPWSHPTEIERRRFEREALALARLTHPGIAQVLEASTTPDGRLFLAMEFVPGAPIDRACDALGLAATQRIALIIQVCEAVEHAHQRGVIHRDLKPNNVLVDGTEGLPSAKVIDFGIARLLDEDSAAGRTLTRAGDVIGTLDYMSPEQRDGRGSDRRSDVYALGVLLLEIVVGRRGGMTTPSRVASLHRGVALPREIGLRRPQRADLGSIVRMATAPHADDRYSTPMALAEDLRRLLDDRPVRARRTTAFVRLLRRCRRNPVSSAVAVAALATLLTLGAATVDSRRRLGVERDQLAASLERQQNLTDALLDDVLDRIHPIIGAGPAREALAESLLGHTEAVLALAPDDDRLRESHARLLIELSVIAFEAARFERALELRAEGRDRLGDLARRRPDDMALRRRHVSAVVLHGDVLEELGRIDEGRIAWERAHELLEELVGAKPDHVGLLDDLTWSHSRLWHAAETREDPHARLARAEAHVTLAERLVALDPTRSLSSHSLVNGLTHVGISLSLLDRAADALDPIARAIETGERLVAAEPGRLHYALGLCDALGHGLHLARNCDMAALVADRLARTDALTATLVRELPNHVQALRLRAWFIADHLGILVEDAQFEQVPSLVAEAESVLERLESIADTADLDRVRRTLERSLAASRAAD